MSGSDVTRKGVEGERPGRDAVTGEAAGRRRRRRGGRGERSMVPDAEFSSYYGRPILKKPTWKALDIAGYLYLGGLAGSSSLLAAGAQATGRPVLARAAKLGAAGAISLSLAALVHDLGRPARFMNMLRVFKPTSPMSVGSWLLSGYAPLTLAAAASDVAGRYRLVGSAATAGAAVLGPAVVTYTAVLISDTAVPSWHEGHRQMPYVFAGSGATAAAGLALAAAPTAQTGPARRMAVLGAALELGTFQLMKRRMGLAAEPLEKGRPHVMLRTAEALTAGGAVLAALSGRQRGRALATVAGAALLTGSAALRFGLFHAGVASAEDPKYTVVPQRERLRARQGGQEA
ncbi:MULTISPECIES: NrfD/PsrC family molybdoenzyme membrane anchor subunit [Streptomyces]|uniref:Polysulfide reductase NrfD n=1 Tax=Streptomyces spinosisporus TaxID=2927582 RepID=A0ABS9XMI7_9ACTN|nr:MULTISPECIES: NrfD/PsrC family molybdoenzyme membrane anchor subunit [Streptomyces]MCI3243279.1 polysulfide reductase NrfD [Streptomyces spinosisporus]WUB40627.1 polysulfide reductase NrfD [Streptomyces sp. NBC_00588]